MLHVEVYIPGLMKSCEFSVNEHVKTSVLVQEIAHMISQKEQKHWEKNGEDMLLCNVSMKCMLPAEKTLPQCRVQPGRCLLLL